MSSSFIYGMLSGAGILAALIGCLRMFARGLENRSLLRIITGLFLCGLMCLLVDFMILRLHPVSAPATLPSSLTSPAR
jgi:xanthine/uracil permease